MDQGGLKIDGSNLAQLEGARVPRQELDKNLPALWLLMMGLLTPWIMALRGLDLGAATADQGPTQKALALW